jgi:hypothetical protein
LISGQWTEGLIGTISDGSRWRLQERASMTEISPGTRRYTPQLLCAGTVVGVVVAAAVLLLHPEGGRPAAVLAARYTARASALWFLLAFSAGPLARLFRTGLTSTLLRERRGLGLAFCAAHLVHLGAIGLVMSYGGTLGADSLGGALAYVFVIAMGASSNDRAVARLGARRWKALHTTGSWFLWLIFVLTYTGDLGTPDALAAHWVLSGLLVIAMLARLAARVPVRN